MATSGTYTWTLNVGEVIDEACDRAGIPPKSSFLKHSPSIRRSLNLILAAWNSAGFRQWQVERVTKALATGNPNPVLDPQCLDILGMVLSRAGNDTEVMPIGREDYLALPNKANRGRPDRYFVDKQRDKPVLFLWPVPENSTDTIIFDQYRRAQDITADTTQNPDVQVLWLEALTAALALRIAQKLPAFLPGGEVNQAAVSALVDRLAAQATQAYRTARIEDRERADTVLMPMYGSRRR